MSEELLTRHRWNVFNMQRPEKRADVYAGVPLILARQTTLLRLNADRSLL